MRLIKFLSILPLILMLTACPSWLGGDKEETNPFEGVAADKLYKDAKEKLKAGEYESAAKRLEALETMYPFNDNAEQAQLDLIYAYYEKGDYPSTAATAERFIHLYPRSNRVDYAYYMKGLANFQQPRGTLTRLLPIDESWRDAGTQAQAYSNFATLVQNYPESRYKPDALQRMIYLRNMFAQKELNIANYYYERRMYVAAIERANGLIRNYPQAPSAEPALALVYHANLKLGLKKAAAEALTVFKATYHNQPNEI